MKVGPSSAKEGQKDRTESNEGPVTGDLEGDTERDRIGGERHKTAGEIRHIDIPGEKTIKMKKR